jgi:multicomponent Na+:H+ antiporter subunit D
MGVMLGTVSGMVGGLTHLMNHALMKGGLFLVVGTVVYKTGLTQIGDYRGMGRRMPITMAAFTIFALSMIGVPLSAGFVSKWYLAVGGLDAGRWWVVVAILLSSLLTAVYFWRIIEEIYFKELAPSERMGPRDEAPAVMVLPIVLLAALCLLFGILAWIPVSITGRGAEQLLSLDS